MAFNDFAGKAANELQGLLAETRGELHALQFGNTIGQLKNVRVMTALRKRIAHILTALNAQR